MRARVKQTPCIGDDHLTFYSPNPCNWCISKYINLNPHYVLAYHRVSSHVKDSWILETKFGRLGLGNSTHSIDGVK